jgi:hypothetical protein
METLVSNEDVSKGVDLKDIELVTPSQNDRVTGSISIISNKNSDRGKSTISMMMLSSMIASPFGFKTHLSLIFR